MPLEGSLTDMSLADLFLIFRSGLKTGALLLWRDTDRLLISVRDGRLIDAVLVASADRRVIAIDEEAIIQALQWEQAEFRFHHDLVAGTRPTRITRDSAWLILEALRRGAARRLPYGPISLDTRLDLSTQPLDSDNAIPLDLNHWRILNQVAVCGSLRAVCSESGIAPEQAVLIVSELVALGLVDISGTTGITAKQRRSQPQSQTFPQLHTDSGKSMVGGRRLLSAVIRRVQAL